MANPFLNKTDLMDRDIETAVLLEQAIITDIGKAVAYTDGKKTFVNTDDNLFKVLPAYDHRMLKWILWHEKYHTELRHHDRFFKYIDELKKHDSLDKFQVTKDEVNIIMDILVHDSLTKLFPELVETAQTNLAQLRNRNSLKYTFTTHTLEEMLNEYKEHKKDESPEEKEKTPEEKEKTPPTSELPEEKEPVESELPGRHDETDWSQLKNIDTKEFITERESYDIEKAINKLRRKKIKLAQLTETLNGLVTSTRKRTYAKPNPIKLSGGAVLKGSVPGRALLYLVFDASGSMSYEMDMFKEIISKSIPQAMQTPCEWFAGSYADSVKPYKTDSGQRIL